MGSPALKFPSLDAAIAKFENADTSYNNPGAIQAGTFASNMGATGVAPNGLATFPSVGAGQSAEDALVQHYADSGVDLNTLVAKWSGLPAGDTSLANYQSSVAKDTGVPGTTPVSSMSANDPMNMIPGWNGSPDLPAIVPGGTDTSAKPAPSSGTLIGRVAAGVIGAMLIGAGLFMFKTTQNIIQIGGKAAAFGRVRK